METVAKLKIKMPTLPNFFRLEGLDVTIPIQDVPEENLREIGAQWTEALIMAARQKRDILP